MIVKPVDMGNVQIASSLLSHLYRDTIPALLARAFSRRQPYSEEQILNEIRNGHAEYFIGFEQKLPHYSPVGALSLEIHGRDCELKAIVARPSRQRKGSRLMEFAEIYAKSEGCETIWANIPGHYGVEDFFERNGWIRESVSRGFFRENVSKYAKKLKESL